MADMGLYSSEMSIGNMLRDQPVIGGFDLDDEVSMTFWVKIAVLGALVLMVYSWYADMPRLRLIAGIAGVGVYGFWYYRFKLSKMRSVKLVSVTPSAPAATSPSTSP